ncbi:hypothetical protein ACFFTM_05010 [Pseudoduganella plicata]|uniref:Uncharacterized protein n=1 Tax=Pseudoduganella plicata TaxID=321984 RepID=A0A4P7BM04_9BURK|nr:hypothetical protein [Pseudoduganella plicata]QBQ38765.1 hypothetical protein E1742_23280 [Pseudoduganella plicata]GGY84880.1 hypothetical protein GCM10007388_17590 [Pseudoduganella plicata]
MKIAAKVVGIMLFAGICFAAGALTAAIRGWFQPVVHVRVTNASGADLAAVVLIHESGRGTGTMTLPALPRGASAEAHFFLAGEGSYRIEATFADGRVVKGGYGYVEPGYATREVIENSGIASSPNRTLLR